MHRLHCASYTTSGSLPLHVAQRCHWSPDGHQRAKCRATHYHPQWYGSQPELARECLYFTAHSRGEHVIDADHSFHAVWPLPCPPPYTLHPGPYTLDPTPYTLHPTPYALHPASHSPLRQERCRSAVGPQQRPHAVKGEVPQPRPRHLLREKHRSSFPPPLPAPLPPHLPCVARIGEVRGRVAGRQAGGGGEEGEPGQLSLETLHTRGDAGQ